MIWGEEGDGGEVGGGGGGGLNYEILSKNARKT